MILKGTKTVFNMVKKVDNVEKVLDDISDFQ